MCAEYVNQLSCLDKLKGPIKLNLELGPCIGVCDVPLSPKGTNPKLESPEHFLDTIERACSAEILMLTVIIPDILLILKNNSDSLGAISRKINETGALFSINSAVSSEESALKLKEGFVDFTAKIRDLNLDCFVLYSGLELLPMVCEEIGSLASALMVDSLSLLSLCSDLPGTAREMERLVTCTREIARVSGLSVINLTLINDGGASTDDIPELVSSLGSLALLGTVVLKPPLPFCLSSLLKSKYFPIFPGICPARNICFTIDASGNGIPCLHKREPSLPNRDISPDSWTKYKDHFVRTANFRQLDDCNACEVQTYCGGLCDIWAAQ